MPGSATVATTSGHRLIEQQATAREARQTSHSDTPQYFLDITPNKPTAAPEAVGMVNPQEEETALLDSSWSPMYGLACFFCLLVAVVGLGLMIWERRSQ